MVSDRFDIEAKASGDGTPAWNHARPALRAMLADRFKLQVRHEQGAEPAYDLLVANGGPRFTEHTDPAWFNPRFNVSSDPSALHVAATKAGMGQLASQLRFSTGRTVIDKTQLGGTYDFRLDWATDLNPAVMDGSAPALFRALQEQLGLKLESSVTPRDVLVIKSAEKPSTD